MSTDVPVVCVVSARIPYIRLAEGGVPHVSDLCVASNSFQLSACSAGLSEAEEESVLCVPADWGSCNSCMVIC